MRRLLLFFLLLVFVLPQASPQQTPESQMLSLINAERAKAGLSPLAWNEKLASVARVHARDMIDKKYFSHTSKEGLTPLDRVMRSGYYENSRGKMFVAENIEIHSGGINIFLTHQNLMRSSGHRRNILSPQANEIGIGFATGYFTYRGYTFTITVCVQVFAYHSRY